MSKIRPAELPERYLGLPAAMPIDSSLPALDLLAELQRLNQQALERLDAEATQGLEIIQTALRLGEARPQDNPQIRQALAECFITRGRLRLKNAAYDEALADFEQALRQFQELTRQRDAVLARSYIGVAYANMGEYADALEHLFEALKNAQTLGERLLSAEITNNICYTYVMIGQPELAIPHLHEAIQTLREFNEPLRLSWALDSLGTAYLHTGDPQRALQYENEAIHISEQVNAWQNLAAYLNISGEIYLALGDDSAAIAAYQSALQVARRYNFQAEVAMTLLNLGRLHTERSHLDAAESALQEALALARQTHRQQQAVEAYRALSHLYEKSGQPVAALEMFKSFYAVSTAMNDQDTGRRIRRLQVLHQLEALRREAAGFQQQAFALQRKVEEQQRTQVRLEKLARTDSLTRSLNRRALFDAGQVAFQEARKHRQPLTVIMFDLDNFKEINDQYGHLVGDQVLAVLVERIRHRLRDSDLLARYGGEEFCMLMPGITLEQGMNAAERVRAAVSESPVRIGNMQLKVTISLGVAAATPPNFPRTFKDLLRHADQALYAAKNGGRDCVRAFNG
ncbi:MAG: diguanylate cyclase [Bellilinea sp.]|jgi:diguanylate cyclase (GGDEF)-like protein